MAIEITFGLGILLGAAILASILAVCTTKPRAWELAIIIVLLFILAWQSAMIYFGRVP